MTTPYLGWALAHAPTTYPATIKAKLALLGDFPQYPKVEAQASPRMIPGVPPHLCQPLATGSQTAGVATAYSHWCDEESQRHLPTGPGDSPFLTWASGSLAAWPIAKSGGVVPTTLWDSSHLTVDQLLSAMAASPDMAVRKKAAQLAHALRQAVYAAVLDPKKVTQQGQALCGNQRAAGFVASFAVRMWRALPDLQDVAVMKVLVDGLTALCEKQKVQGLLLNDSPLVPINPFEDAAAETDDHGGCGWCFWMIAGPYLRGLCEIRELGTTPKLDALVQGALSFVEMAFEQGFKDTGIVGMAPDDLDPTEHPHYLKASAMTPWALMGLRAADAQGLLSPALLKYAVGLRNKTTWLDDSRPTSGKDYKDLSLLLLCGGWPALGWKSPA